MGVTDSGLPAAARRPRQEGFTLVELLVVLVIIGVLTAIAIPSFVRQRERGWDSAVGSDLRNAAIAQDAFLTEGGAGYFATTVAQLEALGFRPSSPINYFGGVFAMGVGASGGHYCLTARSNSGAYLGYSSDLGPVDSDVALDPHTCS